MLFECYAPKAQVVYLAGDFNNWANNQKGQITDGQYAMQGPDTNGVWRKIVSLPPGTHQFKFNLNGDPLLWFVPKSVEELDADSNAVVRVTAAGEVSLRSSRNPEWKPRHTADGVLFQLYAPDAHIVYLAGDFNQWANNRDGLVSGPKFAMKGPDIGGVWRADIKLPAGRNLYQFVIDGDRWVTDPNAVENDSENHSVIIGQ